MSGGDSCNWKFILILIGMLYVFFHLIPQSREGFDIELDQLVTPVIIPEEKLVFKEPTTVQVDDNTRVMYNPLNNSIQTGPGWIDYQIPEQPVPVSADVPENYYMLNDGSNGELMLHNNVFSPSCCSAQYPLPFSLSVDQNLVAVADQLVPSSYTGNSMFSDSGCACMSARQRHHIVTHGGNRQ